jgi:hypothetical protein
MKLTKSFLLEDYYDKIKKELKKIDNKSKEFDVLLNKIKSIYQKYVYNKLDNIPNPNTEIFKPVEDELFAWAKNKSDDELRNFNFTDALIDKVIENGSYRKLK